MALHCDVRTYALGDILPLFKTSSLGCLSRIRGRMILDFSLLHHLLARPFLPFSLLLCWLDRRRSKSDLGLRPGWNKSLKGGPPNVRFKERKEAGRGLLDHHSFWNIYGLLISACANKRVLARTSKLPTRSIWSKT